MLNFFRLSAATMAAVVSIQTNSNLLATQENNEFTNAQTSIELPDSSNTPGVAEKVDPAGIMLGLAAVGSVAVAVALNAKNANKPFKSSSRSSSKSKEDTIRIDQANRGLQKKLLTLLHNDRDAANRLLSQVKMNNPNKSIDWTVEKVIYDLERDRGGY